MKTAYLLPCSCGRNCEVDAGQAGSQVACGCGTVLTVPSIRGLRQLEPAATGEAKPATPSWSPVRGAIFSLGLLLAAIAVLFSGFQGYWYYITNIQHDPAAVQLEIEYHNIDHLPLPDTLQLFRQEASQGLGDQNPPYWTAIAEQHESARRWGIIGLIVAGAGLLASASAMVGRAKCTR